MGKIIRETLLNRLRRSPRLAEIVADFRALADIRLQLVGPHGETLGERLGEPCGDSPLCSMVRDKPLGCEHCGRFKANLLSRAEREHDAAEAVCDAGLTNTCLPIFAGGEAIAYLITGGYRLGTYDLAARNRLRHLFGRFGIRDEPELLQVKAEQTRSVDEATHRAILRCLKAAVAELGRSLEGHHEQEDKAVPAVIVRMCATLQRNFREPQDLPAAAAMCHLSEAYFSRLFHRSTGLRYTEYLNAVRVNHACELLRDGGLPITEIAFASGFQSLSQFNRVFKKHRGAAPREWRRDAVAGTGGAGSPTRSKAAALVLG